MTAVSKPDADTRGNEWAETIKRFVQAEVDQRLGPKPSTSPLLPDAAVIEIIERGTATTAGAGSLVVPNEVRLNGVPLLVSDSRPVTVHEVSTSGGDVVEVTLTLFARRVTFAAEGDLER